MFLALALGFFFVGLVTFWFVVLRPIVRSYHFLDNYFDREEGWWRSLKGFRTMIVSWLLILASLFVELYDFIAPVITGVDTTPIAAKVPSWLWPVILIAIGALFRYLRKITTKPEPPTAPIIGGTTNA